MNLLPFLLGATIIFWGWQAGFWFIAIPLAIAYEAARYINWRWNLTTAEFRQTSHICTVLMVGVLIYLFVSDRSLGLIFSFFQWLPVICAPLVIAQAYSTSDRVDLNALIFFKDKPHQQSFFPLDLTYPYFAICILAASAANNKSLVFYGCIAILISCALIANKSTRFSPLIFIALLVLATTLGMVGHIGLYQFQRSLERNTARFFYGFYRPHSDPNQVSTAIGDIGSVKQSNKIVLRVKPASGQIAPKLLRRATYNKYSSGLWLAAEPELTSVKSSKGDRHWIIASGDRSNKPQQITVSEYLGSDDGDTLLKLPDGSFKVTKFPVEEIKQNKYGTVRALTDESFLSYQIQYDSNLKRDSPPTKDDLAIIKAEQPAMEQIIAELNLIDKTPQEILNTVNRFFNTEFQYSLELTRRGKSKTPLSAFLLESRSGHCEYFATATALLLRSVGIPTRYAVGYSVQELSKLEKQYIVRSRNAHAWTQVYINDRWQAFDTTPASWIAFENRRSSNWQNINDIFSWIGFKFSQLVAVFKNLGKTKYLWLLVLPLAVILIREFTNNNAKKRLTGQRIDRQDAANSAIGADSELYLIERELNKLGLKRDRAETWQDWLIRLQQTPESADIVNGLETIIKLHYRYCFDPQGISSQDRAKLRSVCNNWLERHQIDRQLTIDR